MYGVPRSHPSFLAERYDTKPFTMSKLPVEGTTSVDGIAKLLMYKNYVRNKVRFGHFNDTRAAIQDEVNRYPYTRKSTFKVSL